MATSQLGTFSYDMVLNYAKWTDSLAKAERAANNTTKAIQRGFESITGGVEDIAGKIAAAFAVDKLVEFGAKAIETADQMGKMAQKVGLSVESLSALTAQAKLSNVGTDELQAGLSRLARTAADAATGNKQSAAAFAALGVAVKDSNGNVKTTEQLFGELAGKFASYRDGVVKTADAQAFFGKSGAQLIPLLNELGEGGFKKAREEAEKYGAVISGDAAKAAAEFEDNLTKLKLETEGFANAVTQQLLPGLNKISGAMVQAGETSDRYGSSATLVANAIKGLVVGLVTAKEFLASVATVTFAFYDAVKTTFEAAGAVVAAFGLAAYQELKAAFTLDGDALAQARQNLTANLAKIGADVKASFVGIKDAVSGGVGSSIDNVRSTLNALFGTFANVSSGAESTATHLRNVKPPLIENAAAADEAAKALEAYNKAQLDAAKFLSQLRGGIDPVSKAYEDYTASIIKANAIQQQIIETATKAGKAQEGYALAVEFGMQANEAANAVLDESLVKLAKQADVLGRLEKDYADQRALIGLTDRQKAIAEAVQKATDEWNNNNDALIKNKDSLEDVQKGAAAMAGANFDLNESIKRSQEVWQGWSNIIMGAANSITDAFAKALVEGGSLLDSLANIAKQVVEEIISYFLKLAVINPILNAVFGGVFTAGGGSLLTTFASAGAQGAFGSFLSQGTSGATGTGLYDAGQSIWGGFKDGFQSFFAGDSAFTMGPPTEAGATSSYYGGGYSSGFGQALGIAGGIYAGYNEYNRAGGGAAGLAGGAAYGYGTYAAGAGIATVATTGSLAAGLAAIPVVGWIALAAMLVDMVSGGKLFGTKGKFNFGQQAINVGASGATVTAGYDLKGQQALFGGSTHKWQTLPVDPMAQKAADDFFNELKNQTQAFAKQFGVTMGDVVGGTFIATFDKHGNVTKTSDTVLGVTYNEDQQHFSERLSAENMLAVLDQLDKGISAAVDQYRADADQLMAVTQALANAEAMIQKGGTFLALGSDQTLTALLNLAQGMQQAGETIDQTLMRIEQAQAQYDQFVGQFKPGVTYVDDFQAALADINNQMLANAAQANALAQAAGAEHAATQDLINIHNYAAKQFAAAVAQLVANANSLAASLGYALPQNINDIDSEISALESKAGTGGSAIRGFGDAMHTAAQRATDAMNLLLGDLSPLNDQQKWQAALQGLRAGTATAQQALEIARRLFGTGADYTAAFNQVMGLQHAGGGQQAIGSGGGGQHGLTAAEQRRLDDLKARREQLAAEKQHADALTLAQDIADLAESTGISIDDALAKVGITDLPAFMKELGITDKAGFDKFIEGLEHQTDSAGDDTATLSGAIQSGNAILQHIADGIDELNGHSGHARPDAGGDQTDAGAPAPPRGHGGHARPGHGYQTPNQRGTRQSTDYSRTR